MSPFLPRRPWVVVLMGGLFLGGYVHGLGQPPRIGPTQAQRAPAATVHASLRIEPQEGSTVLASALLEKTLFKIDVARLELVLGGESAVRIGALLEAPDPVPSLPDSLADAAIHSRDAQARLTFLRGIDFERFVENVQKSVRLAREAGLLDLAFARNLSDSLPGWYGSIRERGVRDGDTMTYRIRGDTMRIVYRTNQDSVMVDQTAVSRQHRLSVLGGFLAPGSDFRERLLDSLLKPEGR